jgi:hypothetical protein
MFLEFKDSKKQTKKAIKQQSIIKKQQSTIYEKQGSLTNRRRSVASATTTGDESEDSFESDSDFEDVLDDPMAANIALKMG